jgi:hypothetical protein
MLEQADYERRLAHDLATMLIEAHVDAKRVLAFMHAFLNVGLPVGAFCFDILGLAERLIMSRWQLGEGGGV